MKEKRTNWRKVSDEDLKRLIIGFYEKNGKIRSNDLGSKNKLPHLNVYQKRFGIKTFNELLSLCEIECFKFMDTPEEAMRLLHDKMKNGSVSRSEFDKDNLLPSTDYYLKITNCKTWNDLLEKYGYKKIESIYTEEYLLEKLKEFCDKLGRRPRRNDFRNYFEISETPYERVFGSMVKALYKIGMANEYETMTEEERIAISFKEIKDMAIKLDRHPNVKEYDSMKTNGYCRRDLEKHTGKSFRDIIEDVLGILNPQSITRERIAADIYTIAEKIGRTPMLKEIRKNGWLEYSETVIFSKYWEACGSYNRFLKLIGLEPIRTDTFCYDEEYMMESFQELFYKLERIPYAREITIENNMPNYATYVSKFGSIRSVCEMLDIDYDANLKQCGAGIVCQDNNGNICKSRYEKIITDYFIDNNIPYKKEPMYKDILNINKLTRCDWEININNKTYYVEYFGMYCREPRGYIGRKYLNKTRLKIKNIYKSGKIDDFIFIFPNDMKNKSLDDIFKVNTTIKKAS
ncbi:MAG: hypothetical protein ABRQ39_32085 [Candidatus Eremiobacterota bacterium]